MKVLVACEESQIVTKAFRAKGHEAYSCDIQDCSGGHPEWHIKDDVLKILNFNWDMLIAHPPCIYLTKASSNSLFKNGVLNEERYRKGLAAKEFFMTLYNAPIKYKCIENPTPLKIFELPMYSQVIQPYDFGHPLSKRTLLWLINLPGLMATDVIRKDYVVSTRYSIFYNKGGNDRQRIRSRTFEGIAYAMASQWNFKE
ncbi:DNA cytosine methyltransferase [Sedimentibacter sp.]|uniref:DNA cytosine methyltransferase n=1 Tax=Sedimentibacter sp. TaxID=1960295 RepID=UPI00289710B7|nr:DNA cytosine methyltransferase [Sedimentibacter sp.]